LAALLGSHRLVSLVGPGGIGKTRLAVETAAEVAALFGDGVWFCDLAVVATGEQVPGVVADTLGARQQPGMDLVDAYEREHPDASREEVRELRRSWTAENPPPAVTVSQLADHIDHLVKLAGVEHVGIGSDFDGGEHMPVDLEDVSGFPNLIAELLRRGYTDDDVRGIARGNILRVMRGAEAAARRIQAERPPSEATIEELDGKD